MNKLTISELKELMRANKEALRNINVSFQSIQGKQHFSTLAEMGTFVLSIESKFEDAVLWSYRLKNSPLFYNFNSNEDFILNSDNLAGIQINLGGYKMSEAQLKMMAKIQTLKTKRK
jgi:hypothetical protein